MARFLESLGDKVPKAMHPEKNFVINSKNRDKVKALLSNL
jgi:hypothetical protein